MAHEPDPAMDVATMDPNEALRLRRVCQQQYGEAHDEHMRINGDCPWCGMYDKSKWLNQ